MSRLPLAGSYRAIRFETIAPIMALAPRSDSTEAVAERLRRIRIGYGRAQGLDREMTQAEFGRLTGIGRQAWNNAETGDNRIGIDNAIKLARKTGVPRNYIYLGEAQHIPHALSVEIAKFDEVPKGPKRA